MQNMLKWEFEPGLANTENTLDLSVQTMDSAGGDIEDLDISHEGDCGSDSPLPLPRKLSFSRSSDSSPESQTSVWYRCRDKNEFPTAQSPPYKRVKSLRLMDSPATPKTILEKSAAPLTPVPANPRGRLFVHCLDKPKQRSLSGSLTPSDHLTANLNPFTPTGMMLTSKKRSRSAIDSDVSPDPPVPTVRLTVTDCDPDVDLDPPVKKLALSDANIPRYSTEFIEEELIGSGEFGSVFRCTKRLDGIEYAVKKSIRPVTGSASEKIALNEVYAHAVLGMHPHVVRYFSAWAENDHMIIQNEYCNGGSLAQAIERHQENGTRFSESELRQMLRHIAEGLRYIHAMKLVHMDIKPGNIFISREKRLLSVDYESADDTLEEEDRMEDVTYKIGDLGHVTSLTNPQVEEGDCRYLPLEILRENFSDLLKADIFAFGLTMFEAAGGGPLPKNGPQWQEIREGKLPDLPYYSADFRQLLLEMVDPNPERRPAALSLLMHRFVSPLGARSKAQLRRELNAERTKNVLLARRLEEMSKRLEDMTKCITKFAPQLMGQQQLLEQQTSGKRMDTRSQRLIGKKCNRSLSASCL